MSSHSPDEITIPPDGRPAEDQPRWRQDFPIDTPQDRYVSQRDFIKFLLLTSLAFAAGQFWIIFNSIFRRGRGPEERAIAQASEIPVGASRVFFYPEQDRPRILVRLDELTFVAFARECTHLTCPVIPQPEAGRFYCPCHEGIFDIRSGEPLAGPPRRPLPRILLTVRDGTIYATGVEEGPA